MQKIPFTKLELVEVMPVPRYIQRLNRERNMGKVIFVATMIVALSGLSSWAQAQVRLDRIYAACTSEENLDKMIDAIDDRYLRRMRDMIDDGDCYSVRDRDYTVVTKGEDVAEIETVIRGDTKKLFMLSEAVD